MHEMEFLPDEDIAVAMKSTVFECQLPGPRYCARIFCVQGSMGSGRRADRCLRVEALHPLQCGTVLEVK